MSEFSPEDSGGTLGRMAKRDETRNKANDRSQLWTGVASLGNDNPFGVVYPTRPRPGLIHFHASRPHTPLMAKRRTIVDSDDDQDDNQHSQSSAKRSRRESKIKQSIDPRNRKARARQERIMTS